MSPRGRRWDATKFIDINLIKEHLAMKTILAIDLGKRNSVFCKLDTSSLKPEYCTVKTDPQKFHDIFIELEIESSIVLFEVGTQAGWLSDMLRAYGVPGVDYAPTYDNLGRITSADYTASIAKFDYTYVANETNIYQKEFDHRTGTTFTATISMSRW